MFFYLHFAKPALCSKVIVCAPPVNIINKLKACTAFDVSKFSLNEAKTLAKKNDYFQKTAESYINEYFQNVIIEEKSSKLRQTTSLTDSLNETQQDCVSVSKETNEFT